MIYDVLVLLQENLIDMGGSLEGTKFHGAAAQICFVTVFFSNSDAPARILGKDIRLLRWPKKLREETGEPGRDRYLTRMKAMGPQTWHHVGLHVVSQEFAGGAPQVRSSDGRW